MVTYVIVSVVAVFVELDVLVVFRVELESFVVLMVNVEVVFVVIRLGDFVVDLFVCVAVAIEVVVVVFVVDLDKNVVIIGCVIKFGSVGKNGEILCLVDLVKN